MQLDMADIESVLARIQAAESRGAQQEKRSEQQESRIAALEKANALLESRLAALAARVEQAERRLAGQGVAFPAEKVSRKYRGLALFLYESGQEKVELNYGEIEEKLGFELPPSAYNLPQSYWANTSRHSYSSGWMAVGYKARIKGGNTPVDRARKREKTVVFEREPR